MRTILIAVAVLFPCVLAGSVAGQAHGVVLAPSARVTGVGSASVYQKEILKYSAAREAELTADDGWLTVTGLFWLKPGANVAGSAAGSDVHLPAKAPARIGVFELKDGKMSRLCLGVMTYGTATKVFFAMSDAPNDRGLSRRHIMSAIDNSLRRLGTDYVDLYQIHRWDRHTPIEETLEALHDVVKAGKARYIGASRLPSAKTSGGCSKSPTNRIPCGGNHNGEHI